MAKRGEIYQVKGAKPAIGTSLKAKRTEIGYSIADISDLTGFPQSTVINLENGLATNIDYYIAYAQAVNFKLNKLFEIQIEYKPRYELSENKKNRLFLSKKVRALLLEEDFFRNDTTVDDVIKRLEEKNEAKRSTKLSTDISRILLNWANDGILRIVDKTGRKNVYHKT